jgi:hypothetical protein
MPSRLVICDVCGSGIHPTLESPAGIMRLHKNDGTPGLIYYVCPKCMATIYREGGLPAVVRRGSEPRQPNLPGISEEHSK